MNEQTLDTASSDKPPASENSANKNAAFFDSLNKFLSQNELKLNLRSTSKGVFVHEAALEKIISAYREWLSSHVGRGEISREKVLRKLFEGQQQTLRYALDGKRCIPGFLLCGGPSDPSRCGFPRYEANLMDTRDHLHPRDPFLETLTEISVSTQSGIGLTLKSSAKGRTIEFTESSLKNFAEISRISKVITTIDNIDSAPLREFIEPLVATVIKTTKVHPKERVLLTRSAFQMGGFSVLRYRRVFFLVDSANRIRHCYELQGANFTNFILQEIADLKNLASIRGFDAEKPRGPYIGKLWQRGVSFKLHRRALILFLKNLARTKNPPKNLAIQYSLHDCLKQLTILFFHAQKVEERDVYRDVGRYRTPLAKYRRSGRWIFVLADKNEISAIVESRSKVIIPTRSNNSKGKQGKPQHSKPKLV